MKLFFYLSSLLFTTNLSAQFAPPAGVTGSTAIPAESDLFVNWAVEVDVERGWQNIEDQSLGVTEIGTTESALGMPNDPDVVSLGDGGMATLTFDLPIRNGEGFDFAVFENSFDGIFLELAFVEVSSDGENFVRFPATSNTQTDEPIGSFGWIDATQINNLAGKYQSLYGTPFDLEELAGIAELDIEKITHIRLIDVVGSLDEMYASYDQNGNAINDPFPTPFPSGGFDLDAVGVIHQSSTTTIQNTDKQPLNLNTYPNPVPQGQDVNIQLTNISNWNQSQFRLYNSYGELVKIQWQSHAISTKNLTAGIYFLKGAVAGNLVIKKIIVKK